MDFFDPELIQARLRDPQFGFEKVEGASEYAAVERVSSFRHGTAYVVLTRERNAAGDKQHPVKSAKVEVTFGVIVVGRNYRDSTGAEALKSVQPAIGNVRKALLGWMPEGCLTPCRWIQGEVLDYDKTNLLWADVYSTTYVISV